MKKTILLFTFLVLTLNQVACSTYSPSSNLKVGSSGSPIPSASASASIAPSVPYVSAFPSSAPSFPPSITPTPYIEQTPTPTSTPVPPPVKRGSVVMPPIKIVFQ